MNLADTSTHNPFLSLIYETAIESLGDEYYDVVNAAEFPQHILRWRNDDLLTILGLIPQQVTNEHFVRAFGKFEQRQPLLALRYHGYQFGEYNPMLGDGRGFLYGQVRGLDHQLYDFGTKGSGKTPYSRGGDGMLTLKGGVREVLAAQMLHRMGVRTSRCLSLVETGMQLWRGDEPSPTRSSVMIRVNRSHIRFGTFERLNYLKRPDLTKKLLDHVIEVYYSHLINEEEKYGLFYAELVERVAKLAAQWMAAGFCHAVLNTDNMSITGESFDYGPYAFIPKYDPHFTAAYFDHYSRYSYIHQPDICMWNLEMLQEALKAVIDKSDMDAGLIKFGKLFLVNYRLLMLKKLGFNQELPKSEIDELLKATIDFLKQYPISYHHFFADISATFSHKWQNDASYTLEGSEIKKSLGSSELFFNWAGIYHRILNTMAIDEMDNTAQTLKESNPQTVILRPVIESVWESIAREDNWQPFHDLIKNIRE
ncbi:MAG: YdiU family protein [Rivularia sp. ALOHA_DT_140]|nr:YdiU family protein [Rivularia sp. ALOHA_DT_140]